MKTAKEIALIGVYTALLIGGQFALSAISGVEVVTVLFLSFAFYYGVKRAVVVAVAFSLIRCFLFGFFPSVIILYLVYYPLCALIFGGLGNLYGHKLNPKRHVLVIVVAVFTTILFTLLDNVITPLYYGMKGEALKGYLYASLYAVALQCLSTILTLSVFLRPLIKLFQVVDKRGY